MEVREKAVVKHQTLSLRRSTVNATKGPEGLVHISI